MEVRGCGWRTSCTAAALLGAAAALLASAAPASAAWSVSLEASATSAEVGEPVMLTATANQSVTGTDKFIDVYDQTTESLVGSCEVGSSCPVPVDQLGAGSHTFIAYVDKDPDGDYPPCCVAATSNTVTVTWGQPSSWSVSLEASATSAEVGEPVILTATANQSVMATDKFIDVYDQTTESLVGSCEVGSSCPVPVDELAAGSHTFIAYVDSDPDGEYPPCCVHATSNTVTVTWGQPPSGWSVSLEASATSAPAGAPVTLTATANQSVTGTDKYIDIFDQTTKTGVGSCSTGSTCQVPVSKLGAGSHTFIAYVDSDPVFHYPPCCVAATSNTVTVTWQAATGGPAATGALDIQFKAGGTLPTFPCPRGCTTTFSGSDTGAVTGVGTAQAQDGGTRYTATFAIPSGSISGTATYVEPAGNLCPLSGTATGTVTVTGAASGVIERTASSTNLGSVTGVTLQLNYNYDRAGSATSIAITGGTATIAYTFPNTGAGTLVGNVTAGHAPGTLVVDPVDAKNNCGTPGALDFTIAGDAALALTAAPLTPQSSPMLSRQATSG